MNGERTPGTKNDDSSEFHAQDENNSKKRFSSMREGVSGVLVDVRTDRPPEIENGQEENMIDEKRLIAKLESWESESKEESGLKEPDLLKKIIEEVKDMAVNEEIKARIENEDFGF